ncbi:carnitine O-palmitoyltransferase 2, mitochondrial-like isoform X2 [Rhinatrema bivittatum]|uniref:carnitine O-palmitoyltransferase 2, mitochondrial-like isoform X2 n=1 Tax=Rhinatrema bivittatum TaxID=194408 RepID=UPI00112ABA11|nr:carnitine O-palmitoyltransferase 2, mitochondrial-like isoform X2 [Rhinatrema bivittatum]
MMNNTSPWFEMYLTSREPIAFNFNAFIGMNPDPRHEYNNQLVRATNLIVSGVRFLNSLKSNCLEPDIYFANTKWSNSNLFQIFVSFLPTSLSWYGAYMFNAYPLDMSQYKRLFKSTRIPKQGRDQLFTDESARHLLVMRNGHFYVFDILDMNDNILHPSEIQASLHQILLHSDQLSQFPIGYLTTEERNTWALLRQQLLDAGNEENIHQIDSALFCLCLDDISIKDNIQLTHTMLHGYGFNRWFDKSFCLIVTNDGTAGINFEHSWGDGVAVLRFINEVFHNSTKYPALTPSSSPTKLIYPNVKKLDFKLNESIISAINTARNKFESHQNKLILQIFQFTKFGREFILRQKLSPDALFQLAFQVAIYRQYGKTVAAYEACTTAAFKHGRTETIRPTTSIAKTCAHAFVYERSLRSVGELRHMIDDCSKYHRKLQLEAATGYGFDRHLFALKHLAVSKGEPLPEFFLDSGYSQMNHNIISTSTLSSPAILTGGFGPVVSDGFGIGYNVFDDWMGCTVTSYSDSNVTGFLKCLEHTLNDFFDVLEGRPLQ